MREARAFRIVFSFFLFRQSPCKYLTLSVCFFFFQNNHHTSQVVSRISSRPTRSISPKLNRFGFSWSRSGKNSCMFIVFSGELSYRTRKRHSRMRFMEKVTRSRTIICGSDKHFISDDVKIMYKTIFSLPRRQARVDT